MVNDEKSPEIPDPAVPTSQSPKEQYREQEAYDPYDHEALADEPT